MGQALETKNYLTIPIHLDALYVKGEELAVVAPEEDFAVLPYFERTFKEEINNETANISEAILSNPFQNRNMRLGHGIHLHWALPDALTRADSNFRFPQVPDRWLVTRKKKASAGWQTDMQWVVESNYLFPPHMAKKGTAVSIPYTAENWEYKQELEKYEYRPGSFKYQKNDLPESLKPNEEFLKKIFHINHDVLTLNIVQKEEEQIEAVLNDHKISEDDQKQFFIFLQKPINRSNQPYRYMGRKMPISAWKQHFDGAEYYPSLTATGYGDPTFAALYPGCYSVFGFHDKNPGVSLADIRYEVAGWYSNSSKDELTKFVKKQHADINTAIKEKFSWEVSGEVIPNRLLCYGALGFEAFSDAYETEQTQNISITVANTLTEALSSCMANKLSEDMEEGAKVIEDQLEAMQLAFRLDEKKLDTIARFKELRHENGFNPVESGALWTLRKEDSSEKNTRGEATSPKEDLPLHIAEMLEEVNGLQRKYNEAQHEIASKRRQLFADWYKYMISVYPPDTTQTDYPSSDLVKYFIQSKTLTSLELKIKQTGELGDIKKDGNGNIIEIYGGNTTSLADRLSEKINLLINNIEETQHTFSKAINYYLEQIPGPRYWQPNNPVVMIEGDAVQPTPRHGQDGLLVGRIISWEGSFKDDKDLKKLAEEISSTLLPDDKTYPTQKKQPWNPFKLEWQTQLYATKGKSNLDLKNGRYSSGFITDNYEADVLHPDLTLRKNRGGLADTGNIYAGSSILTPQANGLLKNAIEEQLVRKQKLFEEADAIKVDNYKGDKDFDNPTYTLIRTYEMLTEMNTLAQALNGFNQTLLMGKQTLQLPIEDPLGFEAYQAFTMDKVAQAMGNHTGNAPSPLSTFQPIRAGSLKLLRLRLVDTFGQVKDLNTDKINTTTKMKVENHQHSIRLSPAIVQPARLNFRWLNAENTGEMNALSATTPICGWFLTNKVDKSLMVYDAQGRALGYFKAGQWRQAIDSDHSKAIAEIKNAHLKRVVTYINTTINDHDDFLVHFMETIDDALDNIQPEKNVNISSQALLIGRPVAVVRAFFNMELQGLPAINQDWNVFRQDISKNSRTTDQFTKVQFPVRLGEYGQLNDGLVGYWLEKKDAQGNITFTNEKLEKTGEDKKKEEIVTTGTPVFYSPQSNYIDTMAIESRFDHLKDGPINFYQSLDDEPQIVTMLMDVQGSVHVTTGILPNKEITIPEDQYREALQNIEVSFLHAPLLTPKGKVHLPLRPVADYAWSWVEQQNYGGKQVWTEQFPENRIEKRVFVQEWNQATESSSGNDLWADLLSETVKWLAFVDDNEDGTPDENLAKVASNDDRATSTLDSIGFQDKEVLVEAILTQHAVGIDQVVHEAVFTGPQEIREGWLKLRKK